MKRKYTESVLDAIDYLKKLRIETDTPDAREFFRKVMELKNKNREGLPEALNLWLRMYSKTIPVAKEYALRVLSEAYKIYDKFLDVQIRSGDTRRIHTASQKVEETSFDNIKFCFHVTVIFMYCGLALNDHAKLQTLIDETKEK